MINIEIVLPCQSASEAKPAVAIVSSVSSVEASERSDISSSIDDSSMRYVLDDKTIATPFGLHSSASVQFYSAATSLQLANLSAVDKETMELLTEYGDEDDLRQAIVSLRRRVRAGDETLFRQLYKVSRSDDVDLDVRCRAIDVIAGAQVPAFNQLVYDLLTDLSVHPNELFAIYSISAAGYLPRAFRTKFKRDLQGRTVRSPRLGEVIAAFAREN